MQSWRSAIHLLPLIAKSRTTSESAAGTCLSRLSANLDFTGAPAYRFLFMRPIRRLQQTGPEQFVETFPGIARMLTLLPEKGPGPNRASLAGV